MASDRTRRIRRGRGLTCSEGKQEPGLWGEKGGDDSHVREGGVGGLKDLITPAPWREGIPQRG